MANPDWLPGLAPLPFRGDHLFYAVLPITAAQASITRLNDRLRTLHRLQATPRRSINLHISLHGLGLLDALPPSEIETAHEVAATVARRVATFDVTLDRVLSFPSNRALVLRASEELSGLNKLHRELGHEMVARGIGHHVLSHFTPHVTLLYAKQTIVEHDVNPVRWPVSDFVLVHSVYGHSRYVVLGRWSLPG